MKARVVAALFVAAATLIQPHGARAERPQNGRIYVTMEDGVELAVYMEYPSTWDGTTKLPAILQYDGYEGGGGPAWHSWLDRDDFVVAHAGVRGAGCSGGQWSFFSERQAKDGAALVEWLGTRDWSTGDVGMVGHSYPGYMALFVAGQRPSHLRAITVSGTGDDIYRDVAYPGGIPSRLFGPLWLAAARPESDYTTTVDNTAAGHTDCLEHFITRPPENPGEHSLVNVLAQDQDSDFWSMHSPKSVVERINVPTQINAQSGDEQILQSTRGSSRLFEALNVDKQLLITNGDHNTWDEGNEPALSDPKMAWLDHYVRHIDNHVEDQPKVRVLLESHFLSGGGVAPTGEVASDTWPLSDTRWLRLNADIKNSLTEAAPTGEGTDMMVVGTHRHLIDPTTMESGQGTYTGQGTFWTDGPDSSSYRIGINETMVVAGPMVATIWARVYSVDAEWYVSIQDQAPDGTRSHLTRGYLKASHRAIDPARSVFWRPYHPHTNPQALTPGDIAEFQIEIVPAAFVLRPGHVLRMQITAAPLQETYGVYQPSPPAVAEIIRDPEHPTNLLLPVVDTPATLGVEPACGTQVAVFCA